MKSVVKRLLSILCNLITIKKNSILFIEKSYPSGSNTKILYEKIKRKYNVDLIYSDDILYERKTIFDYLKYIKKMLGISKYHLVITTHGFQTFNSKQIVIELWHGIPLKSMAYMENNLITNQNFNLSYIITNSKLDSVLMASCMHIPFNKHKILGSPRNDHFFKEREPLDEFKNYKKIIMYMPTFRKGYLEREEGEVSFSIIPVNNFNEMDF